MRNLALALIFDQLEMAYTCIKSHYYKLYITFVTEKYRLGSESEERFNNRLETLIEKNNILEAKFNSGTLEFLDYFFELHGQGVLDSNYWSSRCKYNQGNTDLLGPAEDYPLSQLSFAAKCIPYGHTEELREENMLAILFDREEW
jgi:hypothetical protein